MTELANPYIICIDDEESILDTIRSILENAFAENYQIGTASCARDGIQLIDTLILEQFEKVSLVICDYRMPDDDGVYVLSQIANKYPDIKRIMLTAYGNNVDLLKRSISKAHVDEFIDKPLNDPNDTFIPIIKKLLKKSEEDIYLQDDYYENLE